MEQNMNQDQHISRGEAYHQLQGAFDRIETARINAHCDQCESCQKTRLAIAWLRALQGKINTYEALSQGECFSGTTMEKYANPCSDLTDDERALIRAHLPTCFICQTELEMAELENPPHP